ncbi:hypothetical protein DYB32_002825 [Aphanomyces invadans]|nr:hypothetical protein DYB32_002825 [Aphanomyces invadans]
MPMLQTWKRGQKYQHQLQEKIKAWQAVAAKKRVFKAMPLPKLYKCNVTKASKGDAAVALVCTRRALQDEKKKIEAEKKQLSMDMLILLNAMAKSQKQVAFTCQVPMERS